MPAESERASVTSSVTGTFAEDPKQFLSWSDALPTPWTATVGATFANEVLDYRLRQIKDAVRPRRGPAKPAVRSSRR